MTTKEASYTIEAVAKHSTINDFWTVVDNEVYDLSGYEDHPGGRIIMNGAGTDCSILFHQYHLRAPGARKVLQKFKIGKLEGRKSPEMGNFYRKVSERVREKLQNREKYLTMAKISWFIDAALLTLLLVSAFFLNKNTPIPILILCHLAIPNQSSLRMEGQQHANGHVQIFGPGAMSWWAEIYGYMLGVPAMFAYGLPSPNKNDRKLMNLPRAQEQYEFPEGRGFAEHVAIHHVKGASMEHDQCFKLVTIMGLIRLSGQQPIYPRVHQHQCKFWFQTLLDIIVETADCTKLPFLHSRLVYAFKYLFPNGDIWRGLAILVGVASSVLAAWCYLALPCSGKEGFTCYIVLGIVKEYLGVYGVHAFFAQHVWDNGVEEKIADTDWGRYNAESTYSWWAQSSTDKILHPFLWFSGGACPSTLSYHLEHTLFPGVNYLLLPEIAPIVRTTCKEFGVRYYGLYSYSEVIKTRQDKLELYAYRAEKPKKSYCR